MVKTRNQYRCRAVRINGGRWDWVWIVEYRTPLGYWYQCRLSFENWQPAYQYAQYLARRRR